MANCTWSIDDRRSIAPDDRQVTSASRPRTQPPVGGDHLIQVFRKADLLFRKIREPGAVEASGVRNNARKFAEVHRHCRAVQCHAPVLVIPRKQPEFGSHPTSLFLASRRAGRSASNRLPSSRPQPLVLRDIKIGFPTCATPSNLPTDSTVLRLRPASTTTAATGYVAIQRLIPPLDVAPPHSRSMACSHPAAYKSDQLPSAPNRSAARPPTHAPTAHRPHATAH